MNEKKTLDCLAVSLFTDNKMENLNKKTKQKIILLVKTNKQKTGFGRFGKCSHSSPSAVLSL